jgi:hypothetical protein
MNSVVRTLVAVAALALTGAGVARAQLPPSVVIEGSVESTTDAVIFPLSPGGRVQVRNCDGCAHATLQLDTNTRFVLAGHNVSLREMTAYARQTSARPLTISYRLRDLVVSRIAVLEK